MQLRLRLQWSPVGEPGVRGRGAKQSDGPRFQLTLLTRPVTDSLSDYLPGWRSFSTCCEICKLPCHYLLASNRNRQRQRTGLDVNSDWATRMRMSRRTRCRRPFGPHSLARTRLPLGVKSVIGSPPKLVGSTNPTRFPIPTPVPLAIPMPIRSAGCNPTSAYTLKSSVRPSDSW